MGGNSIAYGNGLFVAARNTCGTSFNIMTSPDGTTWTVRDSGVVAEVKNLFYATGIFIGTGEGDCGPGRSLVLTSSDGIAWTRREIPAPDAFNSGWLPGKITYGNGAFVIVGDEGVILQSDSVFPHLNVQSTLIDGAFQLNVTGGTQRTYRLQGTTDLNAGSWTDLLTFTGTATNLVDTTATNFSRRFYRVVSP